LIEPRSAAARSERGWPVRLESTIPHDLAIRYEGRTRAASKRESEAAEEEEEGDDRETHGGLAYSLH
jgi:hypothetical protein